MTPPAVKHSPMSRSLYAYAVPIGEGKWAVVLDESSEGPTIAARLLCELTSKSNAEELAATLNIFESMRTALEKIVTYYDVTPDPYTIASMEAQSKLIQDGLDEARAVLALARGESAPASERNP